MKNKNIFALLLSAALCSSIPVFSEENPFSGIFNDLRSPSRDSEVDDPLPGDFGHFKSVIKSLMPFATNALRDQIPMDFTSGGEDRFLRSFEQNLAINSGLGLINDGLFGSTADARETDGFLRNFFQNFASNSLFSNGHSSRLDFLALSMSLWQQGANRFIGNSNGRSNLTKPVNMLGVALLMNSILSTNDRVANNLLRSLPLLGGNPLGGLGGFGGIGGFCES
ncbi:MAG: hypothetical protein AB8G05_08825 [Oligoflexales bacterium]